MKRKTFFPAAAFGANQKDKHVSTSQEMCIGETN